MEREQHLYGRIADLLGVETELRFEIPASEEAEELTGPGGTPAGWSAAGHG